MGKQWTHDDVLMDAVEIIKQRLESYADEALVERLEALAAMARGKLAEQKLR